MASASPLPAKATPSTNSIAVSVSPPDATVESGSSVQFTAQVAGGAISSVTWTAALGSVDSSGLYTAPRVASQTIDRVSATSVADPTKYAAVDVVITSATAETVTATTTSYSLQSPPPASWYPYMLSGTGGNGQKPIFNRVPAGNCYDGNCVSRGGILAHCKGNTSCSVSDPIAKFVMTGNRGCSGSPEVCGFFAIMPAGTSGASNAGSEQGVPIYYAKASDPWYCYTNSGEKVCFHAPNRATFSGGSADQYLAIFDQAQQLACKGYHVAKGKGYSLPASSCTSGASCGVSVNSTFSGFACMRVSTDADFNANHTYNVTSPGYYTLGSTRSSLGIAPLGSVLRQRELAAGTINHAIQVVSPCGYPYNSYQSTWVFPATSGLRPCSSASSNEPAAGQFFMLDYTSSQINAMNLDPADKAIVTAMSRYGFYFYATGAGSQSFLGAAIGQSGFLESQEAYAYSKVANTDESTICSNNPHWITCTGSGSAKEAYGYVFKTIGRFTGPGGTDTEGNSCSTSPGCYPSGHAHAIDSCVVKTLAGISGGC